MSMRVHNDPAAAAAATQTATVDRMAPAGSSSAAASGAQGVTDQVSISSLSNSLTASLGTLEDQQSARVSYLAAIYARGEYQADSAQTSHAMVSQALTGSAAEDEG
ncbi:MAG TPA: hypothetical protein VMU19_08820 [Bryobacteraceae bacterium]|nr:hypothetical protein [Bryobacteraceae bacterium]